MCVWEIEKTEEGLWALWVPVVAALPPVFLPSSLFLSPHRQLWIWHLNKYESALFFLFLSEDSHTTPHEQRQRKRREGFSQLSFTKQIRDLNKGHKTYNELKLIIIFPVLILSFFMENSLKHQNDALIFTPNPYFSQGNKIWLSSLQKLRFIRATLKMKKQNLHFQIHSKIKVFPQLTSY